MTQARTVEVDQLGYTTRQAADFFEMEYSTFRTLVAKVRRKFIPGVEHSRYSAMPPETLDIYGQIIQLNKSGFTWDSAIRRVRDEILESL